MTAEIPEPQPVDIEAIEAWNAEIRRSVDDYNGVCLQCRRRQREAQRSLCWTCRHDNYRAAANETEAGDSGERGKHLRECGAVMTRRAVGT